MANVIKFSRKWESGFKRWLYSLTPEQAALMSPDQLREWAKTYKNATTSETKGNSAE